MISIAYVFEIWIAYRSCLDDNNETNFWNVKSISSDDLTNMSKKLCQKYHNFFNIWNADQLTSHQIIDHVIDFKSNTEFLYMCMYNMFSAELKTLNNYFNNILVKKWIHKFQNFADIFIFFISQKSKKLCFYVNYCKLNIIIIKNCYFYHWLISCLINWVI